MFKNHPNFQKMKFVLSPQIREILLGPHCIPVDIFQLRNTYRNLFQGGLDFSEISNHVYPELWFIWIMNQEYRDVLNGLIAKHNGFTYDSKRELFFKDGLIV